MRILHTVEFYEPRTGGAEEVIKQLSERLVKLGHEVTVATTRDSARRSNFLHGVKVEQFEIRGNAARGIQGAPSEIERYRTLLRGPFDIVLNYAAQSWTTDLAFDELYRIPAKKIMVPCGYSALQNPAYRAYFETLPAVLKQYDALVYMSESYQDKTFGDACGAGSKAVYIPNGASAEEFLAEDTYRFKRVHHIDTAHLALCVSNHYLAKGHRFVIDAFKRMKRKDTTLVIIGKTFVSEGWRRYAHFFLDFLRCRIVSLLHPRIRLIDTNDRALVVSAYKNADVFLFGSAIECAPLVMYESFASKTPFVTRPVGNAADHADVVKIVKNPEEMARVANYIIDDPETGADIASRAFEVWRRDHTWTVITEQYKELYEKLASQD